MATLSLACTAIVPTPPLTPAPTLSLQELARSVEFRGLYGLRKDEAYIIAVALNPISEEGKREFGVPLLPFEVADLRSRGENRDRVWSSIESYGRAHPEDWAGMFLDNSGAGAVVAQFSSNTERHRDAILRRVGPAARVDVRTVRWSLIRLAEFQVEVDSDREWLRSIDAWYEWSVVSEIENRVDLSISSARPDAVPLTVGHFSADGWLHVISDGIGHWEGGFGQLIVQLVDGEGMPFGGQDNETWLCALEPGDPAAWRGGPLLLQSGSCISGEPLGATTYRVTVTRSTPTGAETVAVGTVDVPVDGLATLRLVATLAGGR